jgi:hypothetical protein
MVAGQPRLALLFALVAAVFAAGISCLMSRPRGWVTLTLADRHLFVENTLHVGSAGTIPKAGAKMILFFRLAPPNPNG